MRIPISTWSRRDRREGQTPAPSIRTAVHVGYASRCSQQAVSRFASLPTIHHQNCRRGVGEEVRGGGQSASRYLVDALDVCLMTEPSHSLWPVACPTLRLVMLLLATELILYVQRRGGLVLVVDREVSLAGETKTPRAVLGSARSVSCYPPGFLIWQSMTLRFCHPSALSSPLHTAAPPPFSFYHPPS